MASETLFLLDAAGIRIENTGPAGLTVRVARRPILGAVGFLSVLPALVVAVASSAGAVALLAYSAACLHDDVRPAIAGLGVTAFLAVMAFLLWRATIIAGMMTLRFCFDRVLNFDQPNGELRLQNVPGLSRRFPLSRISEVVVGSGVVRGQQMIWLCLSVQGMRRMLLIQSAAPGTPAEKDLAKALAAGGATIADRLGIPYRKLPRIGLSDISCI